MSDDGFRDRATHVKAIIEQEKGLWVVYLEITFWEWDDTDAPKLNHVRRRIQHYPTQRQAEIAAKYMKRAAERDLGSAPTGF